MIAPLFKKRFGYLILSTLFTFQVGISQTVQDFTVTDTDGVTHELYADYLDQGKTVLIKIFWAGCPPCNAIAKDVQALYVKWEAGDGDVEFIELGDKSFENDQAVIDYKTRHGITFVSVSPDGNSIAALEQFSYSGTPTFIVVAPDRSMIFDPLLSEVDAAIASVVNAVPDCPTGDIVINNESDLAAYRSQYPACTDYVGNITVNGNVTNLRGLETIKNIQGTIDITSDVLLDLSDLSGLENVTNAINIKDCSNLISLSGLEKLNNFSGSIALSNLGKLSSLEGLKNLQQVGGSVNVENCSKLLNLNGLSNLRNVSGDLVINNNAQLSSLEGLTSLNNVNAKLAITNNEALESIAGLANLNLVGALDIISNQNLAACAVQSLCNIIDADLSIPTNIAGNAQGCESSAAVSAACAPSELPTTFAIQVLDAFDKPVAGVSLSAKDNDGVTATLGVSDPDGLFNFQLPNDDIPDLDNVVLEYTEPANSSISGVSVIDLIRIQNHILGNTRITDPYLAIAADANGNGTVSVTDMIFIINAIIGKRSSFADGKIYQIINEQCPIDETNCTNTRLVKNPGNQNQIKLRAVRIGDING